MEPDRPGDPEIARPALEGGSRLAVTDQLELDADVRCERSQARDRVEKDLDTILRPHHAEIADPEHVSRRRRDPGRQRLEATDRRSVPDDRDPLERYAPALRGQAGIRVVGNDHRGTGPDIPGTQRGHLVPGGAVVEAVKDPVAGQFVLAASATAEAANVVAH